MGYIFCEQNLVEGWISLLTPSFPLLCISPSLDLVSCLSVLKYHKDEAPPYAGWCSDQHSHHGRGWISQSTSAWQPAECSAVLKIHGANPWQMLGQGRENTWSANRMAATAVKLLPLTPGQIQGQADESHPEPLKSLCFFSSSLYLVHRTTETAGIFNSVQEICAAPKTWWKQRNWTLTVSKWLLDQRTSHFTVTSFSGPRFTPANFRSSTEAPNP